MLGACCEDGLVVLVFVFLVLLVICSHIFFINVTQELKKKL